jgi:dihydroneopterin aldolase/2-amino-4-hydroxy-6-hydroxymethyldihydropteridine diphosphokinase
MRLPAGSEFGPVTGVNGRMLDQVRLAGVTATGHHGVLQYERRDGQEFVVDVVLHLDTAPAAAADDLKETVDYGALATEIADEIRGEPVDLIETLAERIAGICLQDGRVLSVDVTVHKPHAPIEATFDDVALTITRTRPDLPTGPPTAPEPTRD